LRVTYDLFKTTCDLRFLVEEDRLAVARKIASDTAGPERSMPFDILFDVGLIRMPAFSAPISKNPPASSGHTDGSRVTATT
jgi:hypothetical protein